MRVLITGANRGIGLALAQHYTQIGAQVLSGARLPALGQIALDVSDPASLQAASAQNGQPLDLLICNAGVYLDKNEALDNGYAAPLWADSFATNVAGVFHTVQAFLPQLRLQEKEGVADLVGVSHQNAVIQIPHVPNQAHVVGDVAQG